MSMRWETHAATGHKYRDLACTEYRVDDTHTVMILLRDKVYESYVMQKNPDEPLGTPFRFMFGTEAGLMRHNQIVEMTINAAPDYYNLFDNESV